MITGKKVTEFHREQDKLLREESEKYNTYMKVLSTREKRKLSKYNNLIRTIIYKIEKESGWEHTSNGFALLSDFTYNPEINDITYNVNEVVKGKFAYICKDTANQREKEFLDKYVDLLDRLFWCEKVRDSIYYKKENKEKADAITPITNAIKSKDGKVLKQEEKDITNWVELSGKIFMINYQKDGINRLLKLLNALVDWKETEIYPFFINEPISDKYKKDLLKWAALFSNRGMYILDLYNKKENEKEVRRHY